MSSKLLPSQLVAVNSLPRDILERNPITIANELALSQLSEGLGQTPLPKVKPESVELYLNDSEEPAIAIEGDKIVGATPDFIEIEQPFSAVLVIDDVPRYVELNGKEELNTLGEVILPAPLVDPTAQINLTLQLLQS